MKRFAAAALVLAAAPLLSQQTGTAHPADAIDEAPLAQTATVQTQTLPASSTPATVTTTTVITPTATEDSSPAVTLRRHDLAKFTPAAAENAAESTDGDIVEAGPERADELPAGTLVHARLHQSIQTATTAPETPFSATLTEPVQHMGQVVFPVGSTVEGRITEIHGGRRFHGAAMMHLQAQSLRLPDGTRIPLNAAVVDTDQYARTRIDAEGNIVRKDHAVQTLVEFSLAAGSGAAAGGVLGGAPGALIGAGIGAGVGTAVWLKQDRQATLPSETLIVLSLTSPTSLTALHREPELVQTAPEPEPAEHASPAPLAPRYTDAFVPSR